MTKCPGWTRYVCMCGTDMADHTPMDNHQPVSQWDYHECTEEEESSDDNSLSRRFPSYIWD